MRFRQFTCLRSHTHLMPLCPHCEKELKEVYRKSRGAGIIVGRNSVFFCPHCHKVLGFGQSRMA